MTQFTTETVTPNIRKVTFSNPPFNVVDADTVGQLSELVDELARDEQVHVVVFDSAIPGYFLNHADLGRVPELLALTGADGTALFIDLSIRLADAPFISIASIRRRTRGGGNELALAFDLRYGAPRVWWRLDSPQMLWSGWPLSSTVPPPGGTTV